MRKLILAGIVGATLLASTAGGAFAGEPTKPGGKCNSGGGNGGEPSTVISIPTTDCDPGSSGAQNHGKD
jgi:hypothetical protein